MSLRRAVGLIFAPGLEPLLSARGLVDVVEIEPEMFWWEDADQLDICRAAWRRIRELPLPKIVHGVGHAVGGSVPANADYLQLLRRCVDELDPAWVSHHLAFNWYDAGERATCAGFFLPPRQTFEGVRFATESIRAMSNALGCELLVETGVSYLQHRDDELPDGEFVAQVCEASGCGVLLDLHNLWTNERNGRQTIDAFVSALPLERVIEVHIAGGFELDGYWLDAHSGEPPPALLDALDEILPHLPAVRAVCFEVLAPFVPVAGLERIAGVLERMRRAWDRPRGSVRFAQGAQCREIEPGGPTVREWERTVGDLVIGRAVDGPLANQLATEPGIKLLQTLVGQARAGMLTAALPITTRLLLLALGPDATVALFARFWVEVAPHASASAESQAFAAWLLGGNIDVPLVTDALAFDLAAGRAEASGDPVVVELSIDPRALCEAVATGTVPAPSTVRVVATVTPSGL